MKRLLDYSDVWLIGGGGKTSLMFSLATAWAARHETTICSTTTKIWVPSSDQCSDLRVGTLDSVITSLTTKPATMVTVASRIEGGKCLGFNADETLLLKGTANHLVVEADGSAGRPVKAHAPHEPQIAAEVSCVVAVVGGWCIGAPLDAEHVHRHELFAALSCRQPGTAVTADDVARVILDNSGWLRKMPPNAAFHVVVTGAENGIVAALASHPNTSRITAIHQAKDDFSRAFSLSG